MQETWVSIPGSGRSPGEGNGNPLQYSFLENPMEGEALVGYSPWGHKESDTTERLHLSFRLEMKFLLPPCWIWASIQVLFSGRIQQKDAAWIPRLGYQIPYNFWVAVLEYSLWEKPASMLEPDFPETSMLWGMWRVGHDWVTELNWKGYFASLQVFHPAWKTCGRKECIVDINLVSSSEDSSPSCSPVRNSKWKPHSWAQ